MSLSLRILLFVFVLIALFPLVGLTQKSSQTVANTVQVRRNISYVQPVDTSRIGDLYLPEGPGTHPAVILIHGGGWRYGSRKQNVEEAQVLARHGYVVYNIDYRLVGKGGEFPASVIDVKDALACVLRNANDWHVNTKKIAAMGMSAGGYLSMMLAYAPNKGELCSKQASGNTPVAAVVSWFGVADLKDKASWKMVIDYVKDTPPAVASPVTYIGGAVPTLFVHGTDDHLISCEESKTTTALLKQKKVRAELVLLPGEGHGFTEPSWNKALDETCKFLDSVFAGL